jgi:DNA-binding response OmpR family regulator
LAERRRSRLSGGPVERAWGGYRQEGGSALRRYIWFLRKKIEDDPESPRRLVTVRGYGYRLET